MPYPNQHSCRLKSPDAFQPRSFRTVERKHNNKTYSVIMGRPKGVATMAEQAYRYDKKTWDAKDAKNHCAAHKGTFEPAKESTAG